MKTEAIVQSRVSALFQRMPLLAGFHVSDDMALVEIEFERFPGFTPSEELHEEIASALLEALDERADALDFLRNRTFARSLQ
jgi:hypothetical protein